MAEDDSAGDSFTRLELHFGPSSPSVVHIHAVVVAACTQYEQLITARIAAGEVAPPTPMVRAKRRRERKQRKQQHSGIDVELQPPVLLDPPVQMLRKEQTGTAKRRRGGRTEGWKGAELQLARSARKSPLANASPAAPDTSRGHLDATVSAGDEDAEGRSLSLLINAAGL